MFKQLSLWCCVVSVCVFVPIRGDWPPGETGAWTDVTADIFPPTIAYPIRPAALIDWNNDQFIDIVAIGNDAAHRDVFSVWVWSTANHSFLLGFESVSLSTGSNPQDTISNLVSTDFNRDGVNDVVVLMTSGTLWLQDGAVQGPPTAVAVTGSLNVNDIDGSVPHLTVANVFGRCALPDLVVSTTQRDLYILRNTLGDTASTCSFVGGQPSFAAVLIASDVVPLSIQTVDLSGQCNAQLVYGVSNASTAAGSITFYAFDNIQMSSRRLFSVPDFVGVPSCIDTNGDGVIDFTFPSCTTTDTPCQAGVADFSALLFVYASVYGEVCGTYDCCAGYPSAYPAEVDGSAVSGPGFDLVSFATAAAGCSSATASVTSMPRVISTGVGGNNLPLVLRSGDFNRDSFRDFLVASNSGPVVLERVGGGSTPPQFSCSALPGVASYNAGTPNAVPFFFDVAEDGRVDVITFDATPQPGNAGTGMRGLWNGVALAEDYFLTANILNGVNPADASAVHPASPLVGFPAFSASQVGAVHRFQWQDIDTNVRSAAYVQLCSTQCHSLENPRVHFGLGKTFSYVQNYAAGIHYMPPGSGTNGASSSSMHYTWPSYLIPNSQVVVVPYPLDDPSSWVIKLYLSASKYQTLIVIALCSALTVIGIPIVVLKVREVREDMAELKKMH